MTWEELKIFIESLSGDEQKKTIKEFYAYEEIGFWIMPRSNITRFYREDAEAVYDEFLCSKEKIDNEPDEGEWFIDHSEEF